MIVGNFLGLPVNFVVFAIITVIVTAGTVKVFGEAIMDPVRIVEKIGNPWIVALGSLTFTSPRWVSTSSPTSCRRLTTSPTSIRSASAFGSAV
jgi:cytosine/uracil/thiamine/allantoin permease